MLPDPQCPTEDQDPASESEPAADNDPPTPDDKPKRTRPRFDYVRDTNDPLAGIDDDV
ncbi:MAG: hypothetical protein AAF799_46730 [Myxococcota bacterium]